MRAHETIRPPPPSQETLDQRVILHGVTWDQYEAVLSIRGDASGPRIAFLAGELELMSPSRDDESIKTCMGRLIEAYAEERGLRLDGFGSMTLRNRPKDLPAVALLATRRDQTAAVRAFRRSLRP